MAVEAKYCDARLLHFLMVLRKQAYATQPDTDDVMDVDTVADHFLPREYDPLTGEKRACVYKGWIRGALTNVMQSFSISKHYMRYCDIALDWDYVPSSQDWQQWTQPDGKGGSLPPRYLEKLPPGTIIGGCVYWRAKALNDTFKPVTLKEERFKEIFRGAGRCRGLGMGGRGTFNVLFPGDPGFPDKKGISPQKLYDILNIKGVI